MRNIRKLLLLALGVIAAVAFVPSAASAQTVELKQEAAPNAHCPASVVIVDHRPTPATATCSIHAITEPGVPAQLYQHVMGMGEVLFSQCQNEFEAAFAENGEGFVYDQVLSPEGGACGREVCDEAEGSETPHRNNEWPAHIEETTAAGTEEERLTVTFCLYAHDPVAASEGTQGTMCTVHLHVERVGHEYLVRTPPDVNGNGGAPCENLGGVVELEGRWAGTAAAGHPSFEVHHLNDEPV